MSLISIIFKISAVWGRILDFALGIPIVGKVLNVHTVIWACVPRALLSIYSVVGSNAPRPKKPLKLYEYEACPFCRKVREALTQLDLDVIVYPCPRETLKQYGFAKESRYRPVVEKAGGKLVFPYLVDENTGVSMYESDDIVAYLYEHYSGGASKPLLQRVLSKIKPLNMLSLFIQSAMRPLPKHGMLRVPSKDCDQPLELVGYEGSPFARLVREALASLELKYLLKNVPFGSTKSAKKVPAFRDPNTGFTSNRTHDIIEYLYAEYQAGECVKESFSDYSTKGASKSHGTIE